MQQITVLQSNGVALAESVTIGINPENIVSTRAVGSVCELVYAERLDRRTKPKTYLVTSTKTAIDGVITGAQTDFTVYDTVSGLTSTLTITDKYIMEMEATSVVIGGSKLSCLQVLYAVGAFAAEIVYASNTLASVADAVV